MNVNRLIIALLILFSLGMKAQKSFSLDDVVPGGKNFYQYYPRYANGSFFWPMMVTFSRSTTLFMSGIKNWSAPSWWMPRP